MLVEAHTTGLPFVRIYLYWKCTVDGYSSGTVQDIEIIPKTILCKMSCKSVRAIGGQMNGHRHTNAIIY